MQEAIISALLLFLGGFAGYFGKRFIEGAARSEHLDRAVRLLELRERMVALDVGPDDLDKFERDLITRRPRLRAVEDALYSVVSPNTVPSDQAELASEFDIEGPSQAQINASAYSARLGAEITMKRLMERLRTELDPDKYEALEEVQARWQEYAEKQAELAGSAYQGGSMQPAAWAWETERLTIQRVAELQDHLDSHRR